MGGSNRPTRIGDGSGVAIGDQVPPSKWSPGENLRWKVPLPGPGVSSPIVVGNRVFVTCWTGYGTDRSNRGEMKNLKRHLICVDRGSGKIAWNQAIPAVLSEDPFGGMGVPEHGYATHTPTSDGKNVYV